MQVALDRNILFIISHRFWIVIHNPPLILCNTIINILDLKLILKLTMTIYLFISLSFKEP